MTTKNGNHVHHVAILVRSIDDSVGYYRDQLNFPVVTDEQVDEMGIRLIFFDAGSILLQLIEPLTDGPFKDELDRRGEGLHHICLAVPDLDLALNQLSPGELAPINAGPRGRTAFLPTDLNGVRTELIEAGSNQPREGA